MISFIVPAYNEEAELSFTLAAICAAASGAAQPFEIVVVDDGSTDATPKIAEQAGARVVSIHRRQIAAARNAGARAARGEYLFFVDADTRVNPTHIAEAIAALEAGYTGGSARVLKEAVLTSGRKLRMYSAKEILGTLFIMIVGGPRMARSRARLRLWYDGKREGDAAY